MTMSKTINPDPPRCPKPIPPKAAPDDRLFTIHCPKDGPPFRSPSPSHPGYNQGMKDEPHRYPFGAPHWTCEARNRRLLFDLSVLEFLCVVFAVIAVVMFVDNLGYGFGAIVVAFLIRSVIRAISRRDDPRDAKRPPDPP